MQYKVFNIFSFKILDKRCYLVFLSLRRKDILIDRLNLKILDMRLKNWGELAMLQPFLYEIVHNHEQSQTI